MYFSILLNYIFGYVIITVEGYFIERFINICNNQKIKLWGLKRTNSCLLQTKISIKDFKRIKEIARKTKCKINIKYKKGMPFFIHKYRKRKVLAVMMLVVVFSIFYSSTFIWNIEIEGTENIDNQEILQLLNDNGINIGIKKKDIKVKEIINNIRLQREDIAWIGIDIIGTNMKVKIVEAKEKPEIIDENEICNVVAKKDGIIKKIVVQNGTAQVIEGDEVKKGDILIGGWIEGKYTDTRLVHGSGTVEALVQYKMKKKRYLTNTEEVETGASKNRYKININNFEINLYKSLPNFEKYDTINENNKVKVFSNFYLPIEIIKTTFLEKQEKEVTLRNRGNERIVKTTN